MIETASWRLTEDHLIENTREGVYICPLVISRAANHLGRHPILRSYGEEKEVK